MKYLAVIMFTVFALGLQGQNLDTAKVEGNRLSIEHAVDVGYVFDRSSGTVNGRLSGEVMSGVKYGRFGVGLGIGVDQYENHIAMPIFTKLYFELRKAGFIPYYYVKGGYSKVWINESEFGMDSPKGGLLIGGGIGVKKEVNKMALNFSIGYQSQKMSTTSNPEIYYWNFIGPWGGGSSTTIERTLTRMTCKFGIIF